MQAMRLGDRLAAAWAGGYLPTRSRLPGPPVAVYASDLRRAVDTAALVTASFSAAIGEALPLRTLPGLRERNFGDWEGLTAEQIRSRNSPPLAGDDQPAGGETWPEVWARMDTALAAIWDAHARPPDGERTPPPTVLVVGHGGSLRAFLCRALGVGHEHVRRFRLDNASLSIAEFWGASFPESEGRVALLNDTAHLAP
jgi:broad specificity phosphatase PhoE